MKINSRKRKKKTKKEKRRERCFLDTCVIIEVSKEVNEAMSKKGQKAKLAHVVEKLYEKCKECREIWTAQAVLREIKRGKERSVNNTSYQKVPEVDKVYHDIDEEFNETNTGRIVISFPEGKLMISDHLELLEAYEREKKTLKKVKEASYVLGLNYDLSFVDELILSYCWQNDFRLITNDENLRNAYEIGKIIKKYEKIGTTNSGAKKILSEIKKYLEKRGIR